MKTLCFYDGKIAKVHDLSSAKFIVIVFAFMCTWSSLTHNLLISFLTMIEYFTEIDLSFIYSYGEVIENADYLSVIVIAPIVETVIFQFVLQNVIRKITKGIVLSVCITAIIFSLLHLTSNIAIAVNALGLGLAFAITFEYWRVRRGYLVATIITMVLHSFWNFTVSFYLFPDKIFA